MSIASLSCLLCDVAILSHLFFPDRSLRLASSLCITAPNSYCILFQVTCVTRVSCFDTFDAHAFNLSYYGSSI